MTFRVKSRTEWRAERTLISFLKVLIDISYSRATDSMEGLAAKKRRPRTWRLLELLELTVGGVGDEAGVASEGEEVHGVVAALMAVSILTWLIAREGSVSLKRFNTVVLFFEIQ